MRKFPRSLLLALREGRVLPFVGAGVSRSVRDRMGSPRFPTWTELLDRAVHRLMEEHKLEAAQAVGGKLGAEVPDLIGAAELAREALWGRRWRDFLLEQFNPEIGDIDRRTLALAEAIWSLECPLVVTTNYDRVLEWASPRPADCESWPTHAPAEHSRALEGAASKPIVWHLHGTIQQLDGIILTTTDYQRLYPTSSQREQYTSALHTLRNLLAIKTFVFFGFGFNDEQFLSEVLAVNEAFQGNVGPHYAFVHRDEIPRLAGRARELSLELLPFDAFGEPLVTMVRELGQSRTRALPPATIPPATPEPEPASELAMGAVPGFLGGRYKLERRLGHGGFATVWQACDKRTGSQVAIKILHPHLGHDPQRVARFQRGAERMGALRHRNIVRVLAPVVAEGSYRYFVMELLGADLAMRSHGHRLSAVEIISIVRQLGDALSHAHRCGLIHRDVKPGNVLLDAEGVPKLTDFDLVLTRDSSGGTRTGALGSFLFAAPEVISDPSSADETADVFGLAMTAVYLFYAAPMGAEAYRNATEFIEMHLQCSSAIKAVLARACSWKRERRPSSVAEFCDELQSAATAPPERAPSVIVTPTTARAPRPSPSPPPPAAAPDRAAVADDVRAAPLAARRPTASRHGAHLGWIALLMLSMVALGVVAWGLPAFLGAPELDQSPSARLEELPTSPREPPMSPTPAPAPSPTPAPSVADDTEARARAAALQRLRLPPTGSARGVTRVALGDQSPIRFIELTGGEYTIGSPSSEPSREINETQHRTRVEPFLLAESEVTLRQWQLVMGVDGQEFAGGPNHPVQAVTWDRAVNFLNLLSQREGKTSCYDLGGSEPVWRRGCDGFRLPSELEFEFALRAGSTTVYPFGDGAEDTPRFAWYADNAGDGPHAVRLLAPNQWGFYDLNGNVWEWVWDRYGTYPASIPPRYAGPEYGGLRVLRGGSFHDSATALRSANRVADRGDRARVRYRGFRVAMDLR